MELTPGRKIGRFRLEDGREVAARLPKRGDERNLLDYINSLISEKVYILESKKKTLKEEKKYLKKMLEGMRKGDKFCIVLECGGRIISVIVAERGSHDKNKHVCSIALGVVKEFRGMGLGNRIMKMLIDGSKKYIGCRMIRLSVYGPNKVAINLYKKHGFREAGRIPKGIKHSGRFIDEIIMVKNL